MKFVHYFYNIQIHTIKQISNRKNYMLLVILMMIFAFMMVHMSSNLLSSFSFVDPVRDILIFMIELFGLALIFNALNLIVHYDELYIVNEIRLHNIYWKLLQIGIFYLFARYFFPRLFFTVLQILFILILPTIEILYQECSNGYMAIIKSFTFLKKHFGTWILSNLPICFIVVLIRWHLGQFFSVLSIHITKLVTLLLLMIFICAVMVYRANLYDILKETEVLNATE